jgi:periplasmic divalent cation tolerance protein
MERAVLVYTTWPSVVEAERAGRGLVEKRLAACVNILPGMISHYWWQGALKRAEEAVAIFKTREVLVEPLRQALRSVHPYETPCYLTLPVEAIDPDYVRWILQETEAGK